MFFNTWWMSWRSNSILLYMSNTLKYCSDIDSNSFSEMHKSELNKMYHYCDQMPTSTNGGCARKIIPQIYIFSLGG